MGAIQQASIFLIDCLFDFYLFILLLRFILQYLRADYYNPLVQFIVKITNPVVLPLRRYIPGYWGLDMATVAVIVAVTFVKIAFLSWITLNHLPSFFGLVLWMLGDLTLLILKLLFYALLLNILISWINPYQQTPLSSIVAKLTEPLLQPFRRFIPPIAGFDVTPIPVMIVLQLMITLIANPLINVGLKLSL